jgi:hypothetical protein
MVAAETTGFSIIGSVLTKDLFHLLLQLHPNKFTLVVVATGNRIEGNMFGQRIVTGTVNSELFVIPGKQFFNYQLQRHASVIDTIHRNFNHANLDFYVQLTDDSKQELCSITNNNARNPLTPNVEPPKISNLSQGVFNRQVTVTVGARVNGGNVAGHIVNVTSPVELNFSCPV